MDEKTLVEMKNRIDKANKLEHQLKIIDSILKDCKIKNPMVRSIQLTYKESEIKGWGSDESEIEMTRCININASILGLTEQEFTHCFYNIIKERLEELRTFTKKEYMEV